MKLTIYLQSFVKTLNGYTTKKNREDTPLVLLDWCNITQDIFDNFRISFSATDYDLALSNTPDKTAMIKPHTPLTHFKKITVG